MGVGEFFSGEGGVCIQLLQRDGALAWKLLQLSSRNRADSNGVITVVVSVFQVWIKHINGTQHAEGQLSLLQQ